MWGLEGGWDGVGARKHYWFFMGDRDEGETCPDKQQRFGCHSVCCGQTSGQINPIYKEIIIFSSSDLCGALHLTQLREKDFVGSSVNTEHQRCALYWYSHVILFFYLSK